MDDDAEWLKLSVEERCLHKNWKARINGYEAAAKLFQQISDDKAPEWNKFTTHLKKFVVDNNALAQEKALEAVYLFVENAAVSGRTVGDVMPGIVSKCLAASKIRTRELAADITLMYIEIEKYEIVQEELIKGMSQKNPKTVSACILLLTEALRSFGPKVISLKPIVKQISIILEDRDKDVRAEGKKLIVELYRWIGSPLRQQLKDLKPVQLSELEAEFQQLSTDRPQQIRFLRSQQNKVNFQKMLPVEDNESLNKTADEELDEIDPYEITPAVDILSLLSIDFYEKIEAKKWQERKEALDNLKPLTENMKLENGDYSDLIKALKKVITKDANVMLIALAGTCIAGLAKGLKRNFQHYSQSCMQIILEKFKERKHIVVAAMRDACDAIFLSTSLEALQEELNVSLENKNPTIKAETCLFLARCFKISSPVTLNKKLLKTLSNNLIKALNESDPTVREAAAEAIGTVMKVVGERIILSLLGDIDQLKLAKIKEYCDKAEIIVKYKSDVTSSRPPQQSLHAATKMNPTSQAFSKPKSTKRSIVKHGLIKKEMDSEGNKNEMCEKLVSLEEAELQLSEIISRNVIDGLSDGNWKTRMNSMEQISESISNQELDTYTLAFTLLITKKPGLKENNFQILKLKLDAIQALTTLGFTKTCAYQCIFEITDKLADLKNGDIASKLLSSIADTLGLEFVALEVLTHAFIKQKNPKVQTEALNWLSHALLEFGLCIQEQLVVEFSKKALISINPHVRLAALTLLRTLYLFIGPSCKIFFKDEKPSLQQTIEAEFMKVEGHIPPMPVRGSKVIKETCIKKENCVNNENKSCVDISRFLSASLMAELYNQNLTIRNEAMQKVLLIIQHNDLIAPILGDLPLILKKYLADSNKNLVLLTLTVCQKLAMALGPNAKLFANVLIPDILHILGDTKNIIRNAGVKCLDVWLDKCGLCVLCEDNKLVDAMKTENPILQSELFMWISKKLLSYRDNVPKEELAACLPCLFSSLENKNADIQKSANDAIISFMFHLGFDLLSSIALRIMPGSKIVNKALEKAHYTLTCERSSVVSDFSKPDQAEVNSITNEKVLKNRSIKSANVKTKIVSATTKLKKKDEESSISPAMQLNNLKTQRIADEQKFRILRWSFFTPKNEFVEQLRDQMIAAGFSKVLLNYMFHSDFKFHIRALDILFEDLNKDKCSHQILIANLDLLLKWVTLRFFETNPSVILKCLEFIQLILQQLISVPYDLIDMEANSFIPYLVQKVGDPKDTVRNNVRQILHQLCKVCAPYRLFSYLIEGLKSKNSRQRAECLEELGFLIENFGILVCVPSPSSALKEIGKHIGDRDNSVRNAALNTVLKAYYLEGEKIYKYVGHLSDKDKSLLDERIKRACKSKPSLPINEPHSKICDSVSPSRFSISSTKQSQSIPNAHVEQNQQISTLTVKKLNEPSESSCSGYHLDLESLEKKFSKAEPEVLLEPQKVNVEDILETDSIVLSKTKQFIATSVKSVNNATDISQILDLVISQIGSTNMSSCIMALTQINKLLKDNQYQTVLQNKVDQLLLMCIIQYRINQNKLKDENEYVKNDGIKIFRHIIRLLMEFFECDNLTKGVCHSVLHDLIQILLTIILELRPGESTDIPLLLRNFNILMLQIIEHSQVTNILRALLSLLKESVSFDTFAVQKERYVELVMKCIWKWIHLLNKNRYSVAEIDFSAILLDLHVFLKVHPSHTWKERRNDNPLRTIKTILHELLKLKGKELMKCCDEIDSKENSELYRYICKMLNKEYPTEVIKLQHSPRLSKAIHQALVEIFKKIGSREYNKQGLLMLYEFKENNPDLDLSPFISKSSQFFQNYIEKELRNIDNERKCNIITENENIYSDIQETNTLKKPTELMPENTSIEDLIRRLQNFRARAGLDASKSNSPNEDISNIDANNRQMHELCASNKTEDELNISMQDSLDFELLHERLQSYKSENKN